MQYVCGIYLSILSLQNMKPRSAHVASLARTGSQAPQLLMEDKKTLPFLAPLERETGSDMDMNMHE